MRTLNFEEYINRSEAVEVGEEVYYYFLEVLPLVSMGKDIKMPNGCIQHTSFEFAEGWEETTAFWEVDGKYYAQKTGRMNISAFA